MAFYQWTQNLSVGVPEMDEQHKMLVKLVNQLYDAMGSKKGDQAVYEIINELQAYTQFHFTAEEKFMKQLGYPGLDQHHDTHVKMANHVLNLKKKIQSGQTVTAISVGTFLKDWLNKHILETDKKYGRFAKVGAK